jgi:hypothetical protein
VIALTNRSFTPEPGIDPALRAALGKADQTPIHALVQLKTPATADHRAKLARGGITLGTFLGGTAYLASLSREARLDEMGEILRWAGPLLPEDKMSRDLWQGKIHDWARTSGGKVKVLVEFHEDSETSTSKRVLSAYTREFKRHGPSNTWAVQICESRIRGLAAEQQVRSMEQGPHPMMPLES